MSENLRKLINLKNLKESIENQYQQLLPLAVNDALDIYNGGSLNGKNLIYACQSGKIVLKFVKKYPNIKENKILDRIDSDIKAELKKLSKENQEQLEQIDSEIESLNAKMAELEEKRESLINSTRLIKLKSRYKSERENGLYFEPQLSVFNINDDNFYQD